MNKNIKAVLFDLDGVLVDACDWHYESLNKALEKSGYLPIKREDHLTTFNGLPTRVKLEMLGISEEESKKINDLKQYYTLETIKNNAKIMKEKIKLHKFLKDQGIKIACVTNSIKETATEMLKSTGQINYIDILVSNEDVKRNKPHPDCYQYAIKVLNLSKENVLCVEDSDKGIQSVNSAGIKNLLIVKDTTEVNINNIRSYLK